MPGVLLTLMEQRECTKERNDPSSLRTLNTLFIVAVDGFISEKQEGKKANFDIIKFIHESLIFVGGSESFRCNILSCAETIFKGSNPL